MALPILDGNQTAATLSTIVTGGQHIPAHTVVSLGSQAISDITSAVSGISVSIGGTQSVTGSISVLNFPASQATTFGAITGSVSVLNFPSSQAVTFGVASASVSVLNFPASQGVTFGAITGSASILNFPSTQTISGTVTVGGFSTVSLGSGNGALLAGGKRAGSVEPLLLDTATGYLQTKVESLPAISGTVTVGNSVTIGSIPAISGTVTANVSSTTVTVSSFPRPTWTDYSGSVVTANSAVTAISTTTRSYLLAQVTTGQMFLNIGATCTTGNGIYFSAGQGFAWETAVPQGIVSIISSVTGTNYVLKDG